jgi:hypothetical protein
MFGKKNNGENIVMIDNYDQIKQYVLTLSGLTDSDKLDLQIQMYICEILAYCYREDVPECMELPVADVIVNELSKSNFANSSVGFEGNVTSYKEGDMQINLGGETATTATGATAKYNGKLEGFKLIRGIKECSATINVQ